ncbi:MAG: hypothetical protein FWC54_04565 [Actinomycetia bacterium]|nr:hypothetical protein [Actinomycetes bacterium]
MLRRDRAASHEGANFGIRHVFKELAERILAEIKPGQNVLEVDAATGILTRLLLARGAQVTALEPSSLFVTKWLRAIEDERLTVVEGFTEDLPESATGEPFDLAIVSFPARRGIGLLALLGELAPLVRTSILVVMPDDGSLDWAYLTRGAALEGFEVSTRFITERSDTDDVLSRATGGRKARGASGAQRGRTTKETAVTGFETAPKCPYLPQDIDMIRRAVLLHIEQHNELRPVRVEEAWALAARTIHVPYPVPRGAATRLVRYFMAGGDRAVLITTNSAGLPRLYGNLRTATHRIARDEVTVRRVDEGIQLLLIPRVEHEV